MNIVTYGKEILSNELYGKRMNRFSEPRKEDNSEITAQKAQRPQGGKLCEDRESRNGNFRKPKRGKVKI